MMGMRYSVSAEVPLAPRQMTGIANSINTPPQIHVGRPNTPSNAEVTALTCITHPMLRASSTIKTANTAESTAPSFAIRREEFLDRTTRKVHVVEHTKTHYDRVILLDVEAEYEDLTQNLGGCYVDYLSGNYIINPLEPKEWSDNADDVDDDAPEAFRKATRLSQHISYLKDFFRVYKDFNDAQIDALEILLTRLYGKFGIHDNTDYDKLKAEDYPIMADLYSIVEDEYMKYEKGTKSLFTEDLLRELCLGLNSMCVGAESKFFNGHTNITDDKFICFGVKGLMDANKKLKDAMMFNILSYMNHKLLTKGHTAASIDELYLFLTNLTAIEYIRNASKRVRKKESSIILASQNIEDFLLPEIKEFTKPLFSIPTHQFLFNGGNINARDYIDALQLEESEFDLIKYPERGTCLFKCGNERYLLQVKAPEYKAKLFGEAGGR